MMRPGNDYQPPSRHARTLIATSGHLTALWPDLVLLVALGGCLEAATPPVIEPIATHPSATVATDGSVPSASEALAPDALIEGVPPPTF